MKTVPDYHANLAALRPALPPALHAWLAGEHRSASRLVGDAGEGWNIDLGGRLLYPSGADDYVGPQVQTFLDNPVRRISFAASNFLFEEDQTGPDRSFTPRPLNAKRLAEKLNAQGEFIAARFAEGLLHEANGRSLDWFPDADAGHLVCFGLGLGLHLPSLVSGLPVRDLVVVDPFPEFLRHSLSAVDWKSLSAELTRRGGRIWFCIGQDPQKLTEELQTALRGPNYIRIDGAYMFQHYDVAPLPEVIRQIQERGPILELAKGFYEDEIRMLTHTVQHQMAGSARLLVDLPPPSEVMPPVLVVGSGPSADRNMDHVARLQSEGAVVISAGTGLGVALNHGVRPDLHCEIENTVTIDEGLGLLARDHDLSTIPLLASWTVSPRTSAFFPKRIFYFRDSNAGSRLFASSDQVIGLSGPTVANLACRAAIALGVKEIYLFGIDLGSRSRDVHHSEKSAYNLVEDEFWRTGRGMDGLEIEMPGNRGGTVFTSRQFQLTRTGFERLIRAFPETVFHNCSDGVRIAGANPVDPIDLQFTKDPRGSASERILNRLGTSAELDHMMCRAKLRDYREALSTWWMAVDEVLKRPDQPLDGLIDQIYPLIEDGLSAARMDAMGAVQASFAGSITSMLQLSYTVLRRLPREDRAAATTRVAAGMWEILADAVDRADRNSRDLEDEIPT
ncbi:6-hydroxymethylpterin diphosphokinase MptE-like protein [Hwanghaeella sp.]|uniref:motility associated factor glycosyltransferase family protein n=1 Tax=Hwanghaeella sp. TaxID=2605943 RepID=UPI003CCBA98E